MSVPPRTCICLQCRTALFDGEACDIDAEHTVTGMNEVYGRECLIAAVWGPPRSRFEQLRASQRAQRALSGLAVFGAAAGMLATSMVSPIASAASAAIGGALSGGAFWVFGKRAVGKAEHPYPIGAVDLTAPAPTAQLIGVVGDGERLLSPASSTPCVAYSLELHYEGPFGTRVMYRDAVCTDFELQLDDAEIARIPSGRIRLFGKVRQAVDFDNRAIEGHLDAFDHKRVPHSAFDPLRYNLVYEQLLMPGDRIRLASALEPTVDATALPSLYRESMATYLSPVGVPMVDLNG